MYRFFLVAIGFFFLCHGLDVVSSLDMPPGFHEANPYTRDILHRFDLLKGLIVKLVAGVSLGVLAGALYLGCLRVNKELGWLLASLPYWYYGTDGLLNAFVPNILIKFGFYVP